MEFAQVLKKLMDERHLSNYELAKKLDIHPSTIANWLEGSEPRKKTKAVLADFFNVTESYLDGKENSSNNLELEDVYLSFAKTARDNQIDPRDIEMALEVIRQIREKKD